MSAKQNPTGYQASSDGRTFFIGQTPEAAEKASGGRATPLFLPLYLVVSILRRLGAVAIHILSGKEE